MFAWRNCWRMSASRRNRFEAELLLAASAVSTLIAAGLPVGSCFAR